MEFSEKLLMERLVKRIWPSFDLYKSRWVLGITGCRLEVPISSPIEIKLIETLEYEEVMEMPIGETATFEPKKFYFDEDENPLLPAIMGQNKPAYVLRADYNEEMDYLVFWSLDDRSEKENAQIQLPCEEV